MIIDKYTDEVTHDTSRRTCLFFILYTEFYVACSQNKLRHTWVAPYKSLNKPVSLADARFYCFSKLITSS